MPSFLCSNQLSFCGAHSNPRHSPLPRLHSTSESKRPKEGRRRRCSCLTLRVTEGPHRCSGFLGGKKPGDQRLGSCLAPWGVFPGLGARRAEGQASAVPQPGNPEPAKPIRPQQHPPALSPSSRDPQPRTPCVWELGADPPRCARTRRTYAGQWALLPASVRADPSPRVPQSGEARQPFPSHLPVTSALQDASF